MPGMGFPCLQLSYNLFYFIWFFCQTVTLQVSFSKDLLLLVFPESQKIKIKMEEIFNCGRMQASLGPQKKENLLECPTVPCHNKNFIFI